MYCLIQCTDRYKVHFMYYRLYNIPYVFKYYNMILLDVT